MMRRLCWTVPPSIRPFITQILPNSAITTRSISGPFLLKYENNGIQLEPHLVQQLANKTLKPTISISSSQKNHFSCFSQVRQKKASESSRDEDEFMGKGDKVLRVNISTTRLDGILKTGLQISKNKIEKAFYEDRIRLNGVRPKKKSQLVMEGDEIDIVRGPSRNNPAFLDVSRVQVVKMGEDESLEEEEEEDTESDEASSKFPAVLKRYKSLTIENYEEPWKGAVENT